MDIPETRFATMGRDWIAYQVMGEGDLDVLYVPGLTNSVDCQWEWPASAEFLRRLASLGSGTMRTIRIELDPPTQ